MGGRPGFNHGNLPCVRAPVCSCCPGTHAYRRHSLCHHIATAPTHARPRPPTPTPSTHARPRPPRLCHPSPQGGGVSTLLSILAHAGCECSSEFHDIHRSIPIAYRQLRAYYIGEVEPGGDDVGEGGPGGGGEGGEGGGARERWGGGWGAPATAAAGGSGVGGGAGAGAPAGAASS